MTAKALQTIIPSGKPNGIKLISSPGWDGKCYIVPRQKLGELGTELGVNKPGLYFLFGKDGSTSEQLAYIGESENFLSRITSHSTSKDFWDEAIIFTGELNKAHVKYLEYKAVLLAKRSGRVQLQNSITPPENTLSDYDKVGVLHFFENIEFILATFGYNIFKSIDQSLSHLGTYTLKGKDFDATARLLENGGMVVLAGSLASVSETNSFGGWAKSARQTFLNNGDIVLDGDNYRVTKDLTFNSPSGAAATIAARSINGWTAWRNSSTGVTLDEGVRKTS